MKSIAKGVLVSSLILAAQAAVADGSAFPGAADDAGVRIAPNVTFASEHASDRVTDVGSAFAGESDDAGVHLTAGTTYVDTHLEGAASGN